MNNFVGRTIETITLNSAGNDQEGEYTEGLTDNYLSIRVRGKHPANRWIAARVEGVAGGELQGVTAERSVLRSSSIFSNYFVQQLLLRGEPVGKLVVLILGRMCEVTSCPGSS